MGHVGSAWWSVRAGEAETGSGGDQPDQGIAGRNSSRTMSRACSSRRVLLPGLGADRREAARSRPRVWFCMGLHRTDRFRHASKNATGVPWCGLPVVVRNGVEGIVANAPSNDVKKSPSLPAGSCGAFPGTGRTSPSRHLRSRMCRRAADPACGRMRVTLIGPLGSSRYVPSFQPCGCVKRNVLLCPNRNFSLCRDPWDLARSGQNGWLYNTETRMEDKAPQGCGLSAASSAGMARAADAAAAPKQTDSDPSEVNLLRAKFGLDKGVHFIPCAFVAGYWRSCHEE
jgi:hypothetical protein